MKLEHIVVATDGSDVSLAAYRVALDLAQRARATVTVMRTIVGRPVPVGAYRGSVGEHLERLAQWTDEPSCSIPVELHVDYGHPSIEIPRYAETSSADLIVLGRKKRSQAARLRHGDTADEVLRRSTLPCLLVPGDAVARPRSVVMAVDRTPRGRRVMSEGVDFASAIGASTHAVTVEPGPEGATDGAVPTVGAAALALQRELGAGLSLRHGSIFGQVLQELHARQADVAVIGIRRGGLPASIESGSVGRHLAHAAPCTVLTIPV